MSESKHTPGPWFCRLVDVPFPGDPGCGMEYWRIVDADGCLVSVTDTLNYESPGSVGAEANARLIAKAWLIPKMLEALEECEKVLVDIYPDPSFADVQNAIEAARAVIAKAKGEEA